ncbi:MAG: hypothetical protein U0326_29395 [Polyangiales bacterium]
MTIKIQLGRVFDVLIGRMGPSTARSVKRHRVDRDVQTRGLCDAEPPGLSAEVDGASLQLGGHDSMHFVVQRGLTKHP